MLIRTPALTVFAAAFTLFAAAPCVGTLRAQSTAQPNGQLTAEAGTQAAAAPDSVVKVDPAAMEAMNISKVAPVYPMEAKNAAIEGDVVMYAVVDEKGKIKSLDVLSGPEILRVPALTAVNKWTYAPFIVNEVAVKVGTVITVHFRLSN